MQKPSFQEVPTTTSSQIYLSRGVAEPGVSWSSNPTSFIVNYPQSTTRSTPDQSPVAAATLYESDSRHIMSFRDTPLEDRAQATDNLLEAITKVEPNHIGSPTSPRVQFTYEFTAPPIESNDSRPGRDAKPRFTDTLSKHRSRREVSQLSEHSNPERH